VTQRSKHIDIRCHVSREMRADGRITPVKVDSSQNRSDICTKPYNSNAIEEMRPRILVQLSPEDM
jgi:hypothetical protein